MRFEWDIKKGCSKPQKTWYYVSRSCHSFRRPSGYNISRPRSFRERRKTNDVWPIITETPHCCISYGTWRSNKPLKPTGNKERCLWLSSVLGDARLCIKLYRKGDVSYFLSMRRVLRDCFGQRLVPLLRGNTAADTYTLRYHFHWSAADKGIGPGPLPERGSALP